MKATNRAYAIGYIGVGILWILAIIENWGW